MTTPAPSPASPQEHPPVETPKKFTRRGGRKGLLGFYIGLGAVALLLVGFYFAWTPLRIRYIEHTIASDENWYSLMDPRVARARQLLDIGPAAEPSIRRLMKREGLKGVVLGAMGQPQDSWALPMMIEWCADPNEHVAAGALSAVLETAARNETGHTFILPGEKLSRTSTISDADHTVVFDPSVGRLVTVPVKHLPSIRKRVLAWWEREGKAKYGRGDD